MPTRVKICGLKTAEAIGTAIAARADYVGLVFYPPSPRNVTPDEARPLAELARGRAEIVALVVDATDTFLDQIVAATRPDMLQLHGSETLDRVGAIRRRLGILVMKAIKVETAADVAAGLPYADVADRILFDAKTPKGMAGALPGGNGLSFDWHALEAVKGRLQFMLSGGLTPANVAEAVRLTGAWAVDVSSGVESRPGEKDLAAIEAFLAAARAA